MTTLLCAAFMAAVSAGAASAQSMTISSLPPTEDIEIVLEGKFFPGDIDIELQIPGAPPLKPSDIPSVFRGSVPENRIEIRSFGPGTAGGWPLLLRATERLDESTEYTVQVRDSNGIEKARFILPLFPRSEPVIEEVYVNGEPTNLIRLAPGSMKPVPYRITVEGGPYYKGLEASLRHGPALKIADMTRDRLDLTLTLSQAEMLQLTPGLTQLRLSYPNGPHEQTHPVELAAPTPTISLKTAAGSLRPGEKQVLEYRVTNLLSGYNVRLVDSETGEGQAVMSELRRKKGSNEAILKVDAHLDYASRLENVALHITSADGSVAESDIRLRVTSPPSVTGTVLSDESLTFGHRAHVEFERTRPGERFDRQGTYRIEFPSLNEVVGLTDTEVSYQGNTITAEFDMPVPETPKSVASSYDYHLIDDAGNIWHGTFPSIQPRVTFAFVVDAPMIRPAERRTFTLSNAAEGYYVTTEGRTGLHVVEDDLSDGRIVLEADTISLAGHPDGIERTLGVTRNGRRVGDLTIQIVPWNATQMGLEWGLDRNGDSWTSFVPAKKWERIPTNGTFFVKHADRTSGQSTLHDEARVIVTSTQGDVVLQKTISSWKVQGNFQSEIARLDIDSRILKHGRAFTVHVRTPSREQVGEPVTFYAGRSFWEKFSISGGPSVLQNPLFRDSVTKPRVLEGASLTLNYTPDSLNRWLKQEDNVSMSGAFIFTATENDRISVGFGAGFTLFNTALVGIGLDPMEKASLKDEMFFILGTNFKLTSLSKLSNIL